MGSPGAGPVPEQSTWHQLLPKGSLPAPQGSLGLLQTGCFGEHFMGVELGGDSFSLSQLDLASQYIKAAVKSVPTVFLMTDSQVAEESFLVVINDFLASGEVQGLFQDTDLETIISAMRPQVKSLGLEDTKENCWKLFIEKVRRQLRVGVCSPGWFVCAPDLPDPKPLCNRPRNTEVSSQDGGFEQKVFRDFPGALSPRGTGQNSPVLTSPGAEGGQ